MSVSRIRVPRSMARRLAAVVALCSMCGAFPAHVRAGDLSEQPLDGMRFKASIVKEPGNEGAEPLIDELLFEDGKFSSAICERYNFAGAPYWIRLEGGHVRFLVELTSPTDGTMLWSGSVKDDVLEGTMRWTKKRWYRTIDVEHEIRGELTNASPHTSN